MTRQPLLLLLDDEDADAAGFLQPLAGAELWSAHPVGAGATPAPRTGLAADGRSTPRPPPRPPPQTIDPPLAAAGGEDRRETWTVIYDGPGLVDGGMHRIRSALSTRGERRVDFEDGESFFVDPRGDVVRRQGAGRAGERSLERALGAPLALALALRGLHLLHASAVARRDVSQGPGSQGGQPELARAIAFTAASGAGKSTLAAAAAATATLRRIADDQLPVDLDLPVRALPQFPQLKLAAAENYPASAPPSLPLESLVEIEHSPGIRAIAIERLSPAAACLALARATVAAKLFDPVLLERHFELCAAAGERLPVYRLRFPSGLGRLPEVLAALAAVTH